VAAFIAAQKELHGVPHAVACRALIISPAWVYKWAHGYPSPRRARRAQVGIEATRCSPPTTAATAPRGITADLHAGWRVSAN
jgi:putative transposase